MAKSPNCGYSDNFYSLGGSRNIGNISLVCPTVYCETDTGASPKVYAHNQDFLSYIHGENAQYSLHTATKAMTMTAFDIFNDPEIVK